MTALRTAGFGLFLGYALSRMGFTDYNEVHNMFTLADPRLLLTFGGAVGLTALSFAVLLEGRVPKGRVHKDAVTGSALFGLGWAITGACPGAALAQVGEGRFLALWTVGGILLGSWGLGLLRERILLRRQSGAPTFFSGMHAPPAELPAGDPIPSGPVRLTASSDSISIGANR